MKFFLTFLMTAALFSSTVSAADAIPYDNIITETIEYYDDGSYITVTIFDETAIVTQSSTYIKQGSKTQILHNADGEEAWSFTVHGTFSVDPGVSAVCVEASHSISISDDAWKNESASSYCSGNQAIGDASFVKKILFFTADVKECHVVLTCDENGNLF